MPRSSLKRILGASLLAGALILACSDKGTEPKPVRYRLYISTWQTESRVYVVDVATDSLIDSTDTPIFSSNTARVTHDGKYLIRTAISPCPDILDAASLSQVAILPGCAPYVALATDEGLIMGASGQRIDRISYPEFALTGSDSLPLAENPALGLPVVDHVRGLVYYTLFYGTGHLERTGLLAWDYRRRVVSGLWHLSPDPLADRAIVIRVAVEAGHDIIYALGQSAGGSYVFAYDLRARALVWRRPIFTTFGSIRLTPDSREVWRTDRGFVLQPAIPGYIYIHDSQTGDVTDSISLFGYLPWPGWPLAASEIVFTPDGAKAYVTASDISYSAGPVLVIDVRRRTVEKLLLNDGEHYPYHVDIGPAP